ncbi:MAG: glycosyltransferase family 39 protein [Polyangiaceae bacterium]|nr:glycosyltransferase family 39 protein [Polyangiaceae bacterium]
MKRLFRLPESLRLPESVGWRDSVIGAFLAISVTIWLLLTAGDIGFTRDEGMYFHATARYSEWFKLLVSNPSEAIDYKAVTKYWAYNQEHPSFIKTLFSLSWMGLHKHWGVIEQSYAFRLPAMMMCGLSVWVTYLFGARAYNRRAGIIAAALFIFIPRVFFHAHLACFDIPVVAMWTICLYVYWRSIERGGVWWAITAGIVYALTLETKHNSWIIPLVVVPHAIIVILSHIHGQRKAPIIHASSTLLAMGIIGPLLFWALWPWIWYDTLARLQGYFNFQYNHVYYNIEFLGKNYFSAPSPRSYVPVMIFATVPTITLLLSWIGVFDQVRKAIAWAKTRIKEPHKLLPFQSHPNLLFAIAIVGAVSPWFLSKTPIYGGTKHWMTAYPFIALFAAHGLDLVLKSLTPKLMRFPSWTQALAKTAVVAIALAAPLAITIHAHPFGLTSYVPMVGGTKGGASLGLNRQFWGYTTQNASEQYLAEYAPQRATVYIHDTIWDSWIRMLDEKRVRPDLRGVGAPHESQIALLHHELHMSEVEFQMWVALQTRSPVFVVTHDEVPVVNIYCNKSDPSIPCNRPSP